MSITRLLHLTVAAVSIAVPGGVAAQFFAARTLTPVPLDDSTRGRGVLRGIDYFADVQRSGGSAGDDRAWSIRLASLIDLWRPTARTTVYLSGADEIAANSLKDGGFNPRGISWELGAGVMHRLAHATGRLGFVHYCKHEIDNSDPPGEEQLPPPGYVPAKRTLSMNGLRAEVVTRPFARRRLSLRGAAAGEVYTSQWDGRRPGTTLENSWRRVRAGASAALRADASIGARSAVYARASGIGLHFASSSAPLVTAPFQHNERVELGWKLVGPGASLEAYLTAERLFDDVMSVSPRPSRMIGVGLRLADRNYF